MKFFKSSVLSPGVMVILIAGIAAAIYLGMNPAIKPEGIQFWLSTGLQLETYKPLIDEYELDTDEKVDMTLFSVEVISRRIQSGFFSGTPVADLVELRLEQVGPLFRGPVEGVGFVDLTERLESEGLLEEINRTSFSPWTTRDHIFGVPRSVHPVLLLYHADIVESFGIDVEDIETWDDFVRVLSPIMEKDADGDGYPDHYLINLWETGPAYYELLMRQAGGRLFDDHLQPVLREDPNPRIISTLTSWTIGPKRISTEIPDFTETGNARKGKGEAIAYLAPDWMSLVWRHQIPQAKGKVKLMPLPAWEKGGARTSVLGGSMLGISKTTPDVDKAWDLAKRLYFSEASARETWETSRMISPAKKFWNLPIYDEPDPYFSGQASGRMYIEQAPFVPAQVASPYYLTAQTKLQEVLFALKRYALDNRIYDAAGLEDKARELLTKADADVKKLMNRNVFYQEQEVAR